jgi:hypothetical protein
MSTQRGGITHKQEDAKRIAVVREPCNPITVSEGGSRLTDSPRDARHPRCAAVARRLDGQFCALYAPRDPSVSGLQSVPYWQLDTMVLQRRNQ